MGYGACSYQPRDLILQHFPNIAQQCQQFGLDITRDPIPVAPAQHYMCGGVKVCASSQHMRGSSPALAHILSFGTLSRTAPQQHLHLPPSEADRSRAAASCLS